MALADKYYTIGVLGKSFGVIELMAHQAKWELRDLAKASGLPKGTLQRILLTLCELGFVSQDGKGGAYSLTLKFFKLGQRIASNNSLVEKARPACRQLMEKVNETVNLCVAQNFDWWLWRSRFLGRSCGWTPSSGLPSPFIPRRRARSIALFWKRANC